jgi:hypothetical protein
MTKEYTQHIVSSAALLPQTQDKVVLIFPSARAAEQLRYSPASLPIAAPE